MIGQVQLLNKIDRIINSFPRFTILVGPKGSGKKEIAKYICNKLSLPIVSFGSKIEDVRNCIDLSYTQTEPICYLFNHADDMSIGAKNCLLKVTEEPPKNAYFILSLTSLENTLETLKSRGTVLTLDKYTTEELIEYRKYKKYNESNDALVKQICNTTGEVDELFKCDIPGFYTYTKGLFDYIHKVNNGNIFKISKSLKLKDTDKEGFNPFLVFKYLRNLYIQKAKETKDIKYLYAANVTTLCLQDLNLNTVSKLGTIDHWIFEVRKVLK